MTNDVSQYVHNPLSSALYTFNEWILMITWVTVRVAPMPVIVYM